MENHAEAVRVVIGLLTGEDTGVIKSMDEIGAIGHRVVHGGEAFNASMLIDNDVIAAIEDCVPLAPLHNPPNLIGIRACAEVMPGVPQAAVFDTAFHQTMPRKAYLYAIPYDCYERLKIRRYGFHGTSHRYVANRAAELLGKPLETLKIITCHMGNGSSLAAIDGGISVDTSMGFTPLEGVPMGTRSGSIDPAIIQYLMVKDNLAVTQVVGMLNKKSGVLGISGISSDFRDLLKAAQSGDDRSQTALDIFTYNVKKTIGGYAAAMGGCDALVFTAGIGENHVVVRQMVGEGLEYMGLELDKELNESFNGEGFISKEASPNKIMIVPTNEELVIAMDTLALVDV
jgi:acetate kinase